MSESVASVTEVGRRAGCSIATVSRVLNNSAGVSPKTREAVIRAMRETEYLSTRAARRGNRDNGKSNNGKSTGGVVEIVQHRHSPVNNLLLDGGVVEVGPLTAVPRSGFRPPSSPVGTSFFRKIVDGAVEELARWGYRAQLRLDSDLLAPALLADINGPGRNGVLLIGEYSSDLPKFVAQCLHPLVLVDLIHEGSADMVVSDNFAGIRDAFNHLYALGHRRIGFVGRHDEVVAFAERFTMYKLKMAEANLPVRPEWIYGVYDGIEHLEATAAGVRTILESPERPTAFVCANDWFALGAMRAAGSLGISIPEQLSVVGFDDEDFASLVSPPLTTAHVPLHEMGRQAVQKLMIPLLGGQMPQRRGCAVRLLPELVVRQSTGSAVAV
jgi:LacI family repressor for deo operon, udp, cdd, tsx, nupC, and nupG